VEVGDLSSRKIKSDKAIVRLFSHHGAGQQGGKRGPEEAAGKAVFLMISMAAGSPRRTEIEDALSRLAPRIPKHEFEATVDHAMATKGLNRASAEAAAWLSLVAYVRHTLTEYDDLLARGYDHESARFFVAAEIDAILNSWGFGANSLQPTDLRHRPYLTS
jgi:hypothetical protein